MVEVGDFYFEDWCAKRSDAAKFVSLDLIRFWEDHSMSTVHSCSCAQSIVTNPSAPQEDLHSVRQ